MVEKNSRECQQEHFAPTTETPTQENSQNILRILAWPHAITSPSLIATLMYFLCESCVLCQSNLSAYVDASFCCLLLTFFLIPETYIKHYFESLVPNSYKMTKINNL